MSPNSLFSENRLRRFVLGRTGRAVQDQRRLAWIHSPVTNLSPEVESGTTNLQLP